MRRRVPRLESGTPGQQWQADEIHTGPPWKATANQKISRLRSNQMPEDQIVVSIQQEASETRTGGAFPMDAGFSFQEQTTYDLQPHARVTFRDNVTEEKRERKERQSAE
jgi:hypothetical protein